MGGRAKKQVRVYKRGGRYNTPYYFNRVARYESVADFCREVGNINKSYSTRLSESKQGFIVEKDTIISTRVLTAMECSKIYKKYESTWLLSKNKKRFKKDEIEMLDLDGERICTFRNPLIASKVLNIDYNSVISSLDSKSPYQKIDYTFKRINI